MVKTQHNELAVDAARVFAKLFRKYTSAEPVIREVIEQMSVIAVSSNADSSEREMAITTLADALSLLPMVPEPVFSCAECVARMDAIHWRNLGDGGTVLRALESGGPGTFGEVLHRVRGTPVFQIMQALTTLIAGHLVEVAVSDSASSPKHFV